MREWTDSFHAQRLAEEAAKRLGFPRRACKELQIVVSELASNIVKYGVRGSIEMLPLNDEQGRGITIVAEDRGPPFRNLSTAMRDGHDDTGPIDPMHFLKRRGIGGGLGAVSRMTHAFRVEEGPTGKRIFVSRYLDRKTGI